MKKMLIVIMVLLFISQSCYGASQWAYRVGQMWMESNHHGTFHIEKSEVNPDMVFQRTFPENRKVCRHYIAQLAKEMINANEKFNIVIGKKKYFSKFKYHVWIEYNGEILDSTLMEYQTKRFTPIKTYTVNQGETISDIKAREWINEIECEKVLI